MLRFISSIIFFSGSFVVAALSTEYTADNIRPEFHMYDPHIDLPSTAEWLQESRARITPCPPPIPEPDPDDEQMMSWAMGCQPGVSDWQTCIGVDCPPGVGFEGFDFRMEE